MLAFYLLPLKTISGWYLQHTESATYHPTPPPSLANSALFLVKCLNRYKTETSLLDSSLHTKRICCKCLDKNNGAVMHYVLLFSHALDFATLLFRKRCKQAFVLHYIFFSINHEDLAKQGDNALGSIHLSVRLSLLSCLNLYM